MAATVDVFEELKRFVAFSDADAENLKAIGPIFAKHGPAITDAFYETLGQFPTTAAMIEGRVDHLKATHKLWMGQLFDGVYDEAYFQKRMRVGLVHAKIALPPYYVEGVMTLLRVKSLDAMRQEIPDAAQLATQYQSLLKIFDLDLLIINLAYSEERIDRLAAGTGMRRALIENLIRRAIK